MNNYSANRIYILTTIALAAVAALAFFYKSNSHTQQQSNRIEANTEKVQFEARTVGRSNNTEISPKINASDIKVLSNENLNKK